MLYFFLSYARGDEDSLVTSFYEDLSTEVRLIAGLPRDEQVGFIDRVGIRVGDRWSAALTTALSTCQVFVALCAPRYFVNTVCGQEWAYFSARLARHERAIGRAVPALLPIMWLPMNSMPEVAVVLQHQVSDAAAYQRAGVRQLIRLQRHRDDYRVLLFELARHIVDVATSFMLPPGDPARTLDDVPNAFAAARPQPRESPALRDARAVVRAAFAAAGRPLEATSRPELLAPGPVWISNEPIPTSAEVARFRDQTSIGRLGYFVHAGDLPHDAEVLLDQSRLNGKPVVTVSLRALRAALVDGRARLFLDELERGYGTKDNLFDTKNALTNERFLFGRDAMLNTIGSAIRRDEHILITGLRKVGKTSLLNVLRQYLVDQPVCMVDLQRFDRRLEDWPRTLFRLMVEAFDRWGRAERVDWPFTGSSPGTVTELESELDHRVDHLGSPVRLTVILDELERVFPGPEEVVAAHRWVRASGALRVFAQGDRRHIVLIGADLRPVANRENHLGVAGTNPLFSFFQEMPLPLLDREALTEMVRSLAGDMGVHEVSPEFIERLFDLTGGHPSLARTIAGESYRQRHDPSRLMEPDLDAGLDRLDDTDSIGYFLRNNLWQLMTFTERQVMTVLAAGRVDGPGLSPRDRRQAEATLRAQGLVADDRIRIGLFDRWIREQSGGR